MTIQICAGMVFSKLTVLSLRSGASKRTWVTVKCECGTQKEVRADHLKSGVVKSCGCWRKHARTTYKETHGMTKSTEYEVWSSMKKRCNNPKNAAYKDYGGRGIRVCQEWESFENFYRDMGPRPEGMSIDRKDNNKGYSKENCVWASDVEQANNRRNVKKFQVGEIEGSMAEICRALGMPKATVWARLKAGWEPQKAFTEPIDIKRGRHLVKST